MPRSYVTNMAMEDLSITPTAAMYAYTNKLCMRNSNTKQTESMHYRRNNLPQIHSASDAIHYCTPLYTIAIPQLLKEIEKVKLTDRINALAWDEEYASINLLTDPTASVVIREFAHKIRKQIMHYTSFGYLFNNFYD